MKDSAHSIRLQLTIKAEQMKKLEQLRSGSYLNNSQMIMTMIDAFYRKKYGSDSVGVEHSES